MNEKETIDALRTCASHWKTSFEHERANVIRLRKELAKFHDERASIARRLKGFETAYCDCADCRLVRQHEQQDLLPRDEATEDDAAAEAVMHEPEPEDPEPMSPREQDAAADHYAGQRGIESDRRAR